MTAHDQPDVRSRHRLTVAEYLLLDQEGAFGDRRTELFDGEVYYMSPKHRPHARAVTQVVVAVARALEAMNSGIEALTDISIPLSQHDVLEPDIALTDAPEGQGLLPLEAVKLVIEISDTTLKTDLGRKADIYANSGIPEYWVVDLNENRVLCHANPRADGSGYDGQLDVPFGEPLYAATIEGLTVETEGLC